MPLDPCVRVAARSMGAAWARVRFVLLALITTSPKRALKK